MKLVTKMKRFITKMEDVNAMSEKQMVKMLEKALGIMTEYVEAEDRKEAAYIRMKQNSKYFRTTKPALQVKEVVSSKEDTLTNASTQFVSDTRTTAMEEVAATIMCQSTQEEEQILNDGGCVQMDIPQNTIAQQTNNKLVIMQEKNGCLLGAYHKDGDITYFSSCDSFDMPVAFGNPKATLEIKNAIIAQKPGFYRQVAINFKSVAFFAKASGRNAMVYLANAKRQVFEGYIGDYVFSTTQEYLDKEYSPLVTRADVFIANGGKHNPPTRNMCTPAIKKLILNIIDEYKTSVKYATALENVEYFAKLESSKRSDWYQTPKNINVPKVQPVVQPQKLNYGIKDIVVCINDAGGDDDYEPEF